MKVLIVDDEPGVVDYLREAVTSKGYTDIETAQSAQEALGHAVSSEFDLITLDIRMPGVSGLEILGVLRSTSPHAVIALVSGHFIDPMPAHVASCVDVMMAKPITLDRIFGLLEGVERVIGAYRDIRALSNVSLSEE
jgi:two-component system response regulator YesN